MQKGVEKGRKLETEARRQKGKPESAFEIVESGTNGNQRVETYFRYAKVKCPTPQMPNHGLDEELTHNKTAPRLSE